MKHSLLLALYFYLTLCLNNASAQFQHQLTTPKLPWTKAPNSLTKKFRFVVIGDLTGGEQPGVFEGVIEQINQLAPDFVIAVGDLIEGYTHDQKAIDSQWDSFQTRIGKLNAPFFYVAGNHDLSNTLLFENWKQRFGVDYYSFRAGDAVFLILNTVEPGIKDISDAQLHYFQKVLSKHDKRLPVYIFSHSPFWILTEKSGYSRLNALLSDFNVTFFCGHEHRYIHKTVDGQNHYMLAKSGGGFDKPNLNLGEFNHLMYCTYNSGALNISNILSSGIVSNDVVNNETEKMVEMLRNQNWFSVDPTVIESDQAAQFHTAITITNPTNYPFKVTGKLPILDELTFSPAAVSELIQPRSKLVLPVLMTSHKPLSTLQLPSLLFSLNGSYQLGDKVISADASQRWFVDQLHSCLPVARNRHYFSCNNPGEIEESWCWSDSTDGNFIFSVEHDSVSVLLHIETTDDRLVADEFNFNKPQDRLLVKFSCSDSIQNCSSVTLVLTQGTFQVTPDCGGSSVTGISGNCIARGNSLIADIAIPRFILPKDGFRLNISFADLDDPTSMEPSVIWWKPRWKSQLDYPNSGFFKLFY